MSPEEQHPAERIPATAHITSQSLITPTIIAWQYFLEDQGLSPHTIKAFTADVRLLASYLPPDRHLGDISTFDLNNFLDWLQTGRGVACSPKSLSRRITSIKAFFRWLHQNGVVLIDPAEKVIQKTVFSPIPVVLTSDEVQTVLEVADRHRRTSKPDARPYTLLALLLSTGIKKGECLALSPNHIELEAQGGPILFIRYTNPQYRYKERKIALPEDWVEAFHQYQSQYDTSDRIFPWSARRLEYLLEDLSVEAALDKHLSFDMCRWTCALQDQLSGMDQEKIRQKMGVSKIQWRELSMKLAQLAGGQS
ncbi:MAG: site-specific integrase [Anaerolineales bacterium]|nr:site-specific integrase [Anaerolineales bacterium]